MSLRHVAGIAAGVFFLAVSLLAAALAWAYLTEYGARRGFVAVGLALLGIVASTLVYAFIIRIGSRRAAAIVLVALVLLFVAPLASMVYPGQITYARFGLTVYGLVPVPVLDLTVGAGGGLWFRDKSHYVSLEEVERLLSPDVEAVIIGIGWEGMVRVDPRVVETHGPVVHVLPTPSAFGLFNRLGRQGIRVVLLAHSTC